VELRRPVAVEDVRRPVFLELDFNDVIREAAR
jgi:hypothetical protein